MKRGLGAAWPVALGYFPVAVAFGALGAQAGLSPFGSSSPLSWSSPGPASSPWWGFWPRGSRPCWRPFWGFSSTCATPSTAPP